MQNDSHPTSITKEFKKFWNRLDNFQQLNILSLSLILLATILGVSVMSQRQIEVLSIKAAQNAPVLGATDEAFLQETQLLQEELACDLNCPSPAKLDVVDCSCVFPRVPRNPLINITE
jgi:hypothetical protein